MALIWVILTCTRHNFTIFSPFLERAKPYTAYTTEYNYHQYHKLTTNKWWSSNNHTVPVSSIRLLYYTKFWPHLHKMCTKLIYNSSYRPNLHDWILQGAQSWSHVRSLNLTSARSPAQLDQQRLAFVSTPAQNLQHRVDQVVSANLDFAGSYIFFTWPAKAGFDPSPVQNLQHRLCQLQTESARLVFKITNLQIQYNITVSSESVSTTWIT